MGTASFVFSRADGRELLSLMFVSIGVGIVYESDAAETVGRLVRDYGERAFRYAYRLTGNIDEAKELVQESYRRVLSNWDKYDPDQPLEIWFFAILRNFFLDGTRGYERRHVVSIDAPTNGEDESRPGSLCDRIADGEPGVEAILERLEDVELVRRTMERLSVDHRTVLALSMEGLDYGRIALVIGCPEGTVRSRVSRARAAFRAVLMERTDGAVPLAEANP